LAATFFTAGFFAAGVFAGVLTAGLTAGFAAVARTAGFAWVFCVAMVAPLENNINNIYFFATLSNRKRAARLISQIFADFTFT
jgi:hypothetical protein